MSDDELLAQVKNLIKPLLDQKPHALTPQFLYELNILLQIDSVKYMKSGLRSLIQLFTFDNLAQVKETIYACLQLIIDNENQR
jgi:hypothetical protein